MKGLKREQNIQVRTRGLSVKSKQEQQKGHFVIERHPMYEKPVIRNVIYCKR